MFHALPLLCHFPFCSCQAGEKRRQEQALEAAGQPQSQQQQHQQAGQHANFMYSAPPPLPPGKGGPAAANPELPHLQTVLEGMEAASQLDAFGRYLLGMVLADKGLKAAARVVLCSSVNEYPWNWMAWKKLEVRMRGIAINERVQNRHVR